MVQVFLFLLSIILLKGNCNLTLEVKPYSTVSYGGTVTLQCSGNDVKWTRGSEELSNTENSLVINDLYKSTNIKCSERNSPANFVIETVTVANVAGMSSDDCRDGCEVSCTLYPLTEKPSYTVWSWGSRPEELEEGKTYINDETEITHRLDELKYSSLRTKLRIKNIDETKYFTCLFKWELANGDNFTITETVSALIRPTSDCHTKTCVKKEQCHSDMVNTNSTCRGECRECYTYDYIEGDFVNNDKAGMSCQADKDWCEKYLVSKTKCSDIDKDNIANYCKKCGYCLAEFTTSKLILPLIILACLCLLTVLMCYKSYEEKRSVLPKVHVTKSDPEASQRQVKKGVSKFVPQVSMIKENRCATDEKFRLKVKSKGAVAVAPPVNGTAAAVNNKQSASQII
ncbi:hypothetical protein ACHWQZ_G004050 [Mnemiopsis leidyi]